MSEQANYALQDIAMRESLADDYVNGSMSLQDAYEYGFIDETGTEQEGVQSAWDRSFIPTTENVDNALRIAELELDNAIIGRNAVDYKNIGGSVSDIDYEDAFCDSAKDRAMAELSVDMINRKKAAQMINTKESSRQRISEKDLLEAGFIPLDYPNGERKWDNEKLNITLRREFPTCNICEKSMTSREGIYGKFYFCSCEKQSTVSDKYWQSVRLK